MKQRLVHGIKITTDIDSGWGVDRSTQVIDFFAHWNKLEFWHVTELRFRKCSLDVILSDTYIADTHLKHIEKIDVRWNIITRRKDGFRILCM